jgi:RNA polymerase sigma-70 factor (ECF subfamily)
MREEPKRDPSDEDLALLARGDPEGPEGRRAACELLGRHRMTVFRWCRGMVRDPDDAMDLAQDVLLNAYRNLDKFKGWGRFSVWLFVIARNRCLDVLRRPSLLTDDGRDPDSLADLRSGPDREIEEAEDEEALLDLIRRHLDQKEQEALWLRCFEKVPVGTITMLLGIRHASGARAVLQSARRKLRAALAGEGEGIDE